MKTLFILTTSFLIFAGCASKEGKAPDSPKVPIAGYAPVNGLKMYYEIHGEGSPLVLIPGGGSNIESNYSVLLPLLAKKYRVIAIEEQGHGHTQDPGRAFSFENTADDVAAVLDYLKIEKADIFGFSNGGNVAMQIGIRHPKKVNHLIIASAFYRRDGMVKNFWDWMKNGTLANMPEALKISDQKINPDPKHLEHMFQLDSQRMLNFKDWPDSAIKKISAPTLIISGESDVVLPEHALRIFRLLPKGRLLILPAGHGDYLGEVAMKKDQSRLPEALSLVVEEFLR